MIAAVLAWLKRLPAAYVYLLCLGTVAISLFGINQTRNLLDATATPLAQRSDQEIERTLRDWAFKRGMGIEPDSTPDTVFSFITRDPQGRRVTIQKPRKDPTLLVMGTKLMFSPQDKAVFDKLPKQVQAKILRDMSVEMARLGIYYQVGDPDSFTFYTEVSLDESMNEALLLDRILFIRRAVTLAQLIIEQGLQQVHEASP